MPSETRAFQHRRVECGDIVRIADNVLLCVSGIGTASAQRAAEALLARGATALLSWGVAAALAPGVTAGQVVLPTVVIGHEGQALRVDRDWHQRVHRRISVDMTVHVGALVETLSVVTEPVRKLELGATRDAIAADMESAAVARVAERIGVPFLAVRAIADDVRMQVPGWIMESLDPISGRVHAGRFGTALLRNFGDVAHVVRLAHGVKAATAALQRVWRRTGGDVMLVR